MKSKKAAAAILLVFVMVLGMVPVYALAGLLGDDDNADFAESLPIEESVQIEEPSPDEESLLNEDEAAIAIAGGEETSAGEEAMLPSGSNSPIMPFNDPPIPKAVLIELTNVAVLLNGTPVASGSTIEFKDNDVFRMEFTWRAPGTFANPAEHINDGDWAVIQLWPANSLPFTVDISGNLLDSSNKTIGTYTINNGRMDLAFNDSLSQETHVSGTIWVQAIVNVSTFPVVEDEVFFHDESFSFTFIIPPTSPNIASLRKTQQGYTGTPREINRVNWFIDVNTRLDANTTPGTVTDTIVTPNHKIDADSIKIHELNVTIPSGDLSLGADVTSSFAINVAPDGESMTVTFSDLNRKAYRIILATIPDSGYDDGTSVTFTNRASIEIGAFNSSSDAQIVINLPFVWNPDNSTPASSKTATSYNVPAGANPANIQWTIQTDAFGTNGQDLVITDNFRDHANTGMLADARNFTVRRIPLNAPTTASGSPTISGSWSTLAASLYTVAHNANGFTLTIPSDQLRESANLERYYRYEVIFTTDVVGLNDTDADGSLLYPRVWRNTASFNNGGVARTAEISRPVWIPGEPSTTKTGVFNVSTSTTAPNNIRWTITVDAYGTNGQDLIITDSFGIPPEFGKLAQARNFTVQRALITPNATGTGTSIGSYSAVSSGYTIVHNAGGDGFVLTIPSNLLREPDGQQRWYRFQVLFTTDIEGWDETNTDGTLLYPRIWSNTASFNNTAARRTGTIERPLSIWQPTNPRTIKTGTYTAPTNTLSAFITWTIQVDAYHTNGNDLVITDTFGVLGRLAQAENFTVRRALLTPPSNGSPTGTPTAGSYTTLAASNYTIENSTDNGFTLTIPSALLREQTGEQRAYRFEIVFRTYIVGLNDVNADGTPVYPKSWSNTAQISNGTQATANITTGTWFSNPTIVKTAGGANTLNKTIPWAVTVNPVGNVLTGPIVAGVRQGIKIVDAFGYATGAGGDLSKFSMTLVESSLMVTNAGVLLTRNAQTNGYTLEVNTDATTGFTLTLTPDVEISGANLVITYDTLYDTGEQDELGLFNNGALMTFRNRAEINSHRQGNNTAWSALSAWVDCAISSLAFNNAAKSGVNSSGRLDWIILLNHVNPANLTAPITLHDWWGTDENRQQSLDWDSIVVQVRPRGGTGEWVSHSDYTVTEGDYVARSFRMILNNVGEQEVRIQYSTYRTGAPVATYVNNLRVGNGLTIQATIGNVPTTMLAKTSELAANNTIIWTLTVNQALYTLNDAQIIDVMSPGHILLPDTIEIRSESATGTLLVKDVDYSVTHTRGADDQTTLTITFLKQINTQHVVKYSTLIDPGTLDDPVDGQYSVSNTARFMGEGIQLGSGTKTVHSAWVTSGATGSGVRASVHVEKVAAEDNSIKLEGAVFEIESLSFSSDKTRYTTGTDGKAYLGNLRAGQYRLTEVTPPFGYALSEPNAQVFTVTEEHEDTGLVVTFENPSLANTPIVITANSQSREYNGLPLTNGGHTATGLLAGVRSEVVVVGSQTEVGGTIGNNKIDQSTFKLFYGDDDVTNFFTNVTFYDGTLIVTQRELTITAASNSKQYDGLPLTDSGYSITAGSLAPNQELISVVVTGSQTIPGSSNNVSSGAVIMANNADVTSNYHITYRPGTLTVTDREFNDGEFVIIAADDSKVYDGTALSNNGFTHSALPAGVTRVEAVISGSQTNAGSSDNRVVSHRLFNGDTDVTAYFTGVKYEHGTLTVTPRAITIEAASNDKLFDGTPLTDSGYRLIDGTTLAPNQELVSVTVTGSQLPPGWSYNVPSNAVIRNSAGNNVTSNYVIRYENGTLTVFPNDSDEIFIIAASESRVYNGLPLRNNGYTYTPTVLPQGVTEIRAVRVEGEQTEVGGTPGNNEITYYELWNGNVNVTEFFTNVTLVPGTLTVTAREITIEGRTDRKEYDGIALTNPNWDITSGSPANGQVLEYVEVVGSQLNPGWSYNVAVEGTAFITANGVDVTSNYHITYRPGTLTVTDKEFNDGEFVIIAADDSKVYDGTALSNDGFTHSDLPAGVTRVEVVISGSQTNAGSSDNRVVSHRLFNGDTDVTAFFKGVKYEHGTLTVTARAITIEAATNSKVYDGIPLTDSGYRLISGTSLAPNQEFVSVTVTGSQLPPGWSYNVPSNAVIRDSAENDVTSNYSIIYINGTLTVTNDSTTEIVITASNDSMVYDGTTLRNNGFSHSALPVGVTHITAEVDGSQTEVGGMTGNNVITSYVLWNGTTIVTDFFTNVRLVPGTLTVTPRPLMITAASESREYNGIALENSNYFITAGNLADGQDLEYVKVTGSQLLPGSSTNMPSDAFITAKGAEVTHNYDITYIPGTLEIYPNSTDAITITASGGSKVYDGTELRNSEYTHSNPLPEGVTHITAVVSGSQLVVGSSANTITNYELWDGAENVTENFTNVVLVNSTLTVTQRPLTISAESDTKVYDGAPLTNSAYSITSGTLAANQVLSSVTVTGSQTLPGSSYNTPSDAVITAEGIGNVTVNYNITYVTGTLTVTDLPTTPAPPTVTPTPETTPPPPPPGGTTETTPPPPPPPPSDTTPDMPPPAEIVDVPDGVVPTSRNPLIELLENIVPLGSFLHSGAFSLLNLIMSLIAITNTVILSIMIIIKRREDNNDLQSADDGSKTVAKENENDENSDKRLRLIGLKITALLAGIIPLILFLVLEDFPAPIVWITRWTPIIGAAFIIHMVMVTVHFAVKKRTSKSKETDEDLMTADLI